MTITSRLFKMLFTALMVSIAASCSKSGADRSSTAAQPEAQAMMKQFEQKDHLFKLSPPTGWRWDEKPGNVKVSDPRTGNAISIQFAPAGEHSNDDIKELLRKGNQAMIERVVKPSGGTVIKEEERQLAGVYARQLTFLQSHNGQTGTVTYISLFAKGRAFTITFGGPDKNQVAEMRTSIETFRFK